MQLLQDLVGGHPVEYPLRALVPHRTVRRNGSANGNLLGRRQDHDLNVAADSPPGAGGTRPTDGSRVFPLRF